MREEVVCMFVSEYYGLVEEFDKKVVFNCILDKDSPFS